MEWAAKELIPDVLRTHVHSNFLFRMTALSLITSLASSVGTTILCGTMLPIVLRMGSDPVPNIRFNVAKTLQALLPLFETAVVQQQVKPRLFEPSEDADKDVQYYASQALQFC